VQCHHPSAPLLPSYDGTSCVLLPQSLHSPPNPTSPWVLPIPGTDAASAAGQGTYLTLRRLQLWLAEPLRRMRLLAALVDAAGSMEGGYLAGRVWAASKVGDPVARAYATRMLQQVRRCGRWGVYVCIAHKQCIQPYNDPVERGRVK
jgi:hypothetical protein